MGTTTGNPSPGPGGQPWSYEAQTGGGILGAADAWYTMTASPPALLVWDDTWDATTISGQANQLLFAQTFTKPTANNTPEQTAVTVPSTEVLVQAGESIGITHRGRGPSSAGGWFNIIDTVTLTSTTCP
jgi:hypothetical protein